MEKDFDLIIYEREINPTPPTYKFNYYNVRNNAWLFLLANNIRQYPLDLRAIAQNNNWIIWSYEKYCETKQIDEEELIRRHPDGFTVLLQNGTYLICYNGRNNKQRNRFTICHEFGHIVLQHLYKGDKLEREANMFAARILMPMLLIQELDISNPEELSKLCDVSVESATYRLKRYKEIQPRGKFYTNPLEIKLFKQLKEFIKKQKEK